MGTRRPRCLSCNRYLTVWGKTSYGKKRYGCNSCHKTRVYKYHKKKVDFFSLFRQYVLWGNTYEMLASLSGYTIPYLVQRFHEYFSEEPPILPPFDQSNFKEAYLLIDGLWFGKWFVLMVYRQSKTLIILHIAIAGREAGTKIKKDLEHVLLLGYHFTGIVSDGGTGILKAINIVFPHISHQICLAHMHRDIIASIGRYPKDIRVRDLKILSDHIWLIESREALNWWKSKVSIWIKQNINFIKERRYDQDWNWWYVHKGVRRAISILKVLPYTSFKFLDHPLMPKTTNELEAQFGHLGKRFLAHRGLKRERWEDFLKWFVYFYNQGKLSNSKAKED